MITLGVAAALVLVIAVCEIAGWPFLAGPVQTQLAKVLDRKVVFGSDADKGVRIHLIPGVRISAASIEIGAPEWSQAPHMVLATDAKLSLGYWDLYQAWRGQPLHVKSLEAGGLDVVVERMADGRASWQFGKKAAPETSDKPAAIPTFGRLRVVDGHVVYRDAILPAAIDSRFALDDGSGTPADLAAAAAAASGASSPVASASAASAGGIVVMAGGAASKIREEPPVSLAPGETGLVLKATGTYRKNLPVDIDLRTSGVLRLFDGSAEAEAQPLRLEAKIGNAQLSFAGSTVDPLHFRGLKGTFRVKGTSLAAAGDPLGITLPTTPAFDTHGTISKDRDVYNAVFESAEIGSTRINGAFTFDRRPKVPLLSGKIGGSRLVLADLGPAIGTPASDTAKTETKGAGRVIPDKKFDLPSLRAMDANVLVDIAMFDPGTTIIEPLRPVRGHILLADGVLTIADFEGTTAKGQLLGFLQLDGRAEQAKWTADLRARGIDLAQWLRFKRGEGAPPYLSGKLDALVKVTGTGRSTAEILGSLGGDIRVHLRDASISHLAMEAGGIDIAQALGMVLKGDDALPIQCNVADLDVQQGVARPKVFVLNTQDSTIWIDGTVSLKSEDLDLKAVVSPKDFSPLTLRTPIHVRGTFGAPKVSLELKRLAGKAAAAGLLALLNPLAAIIPFVDLGSKGEANKEDDQCKALVRTSGAIPAAVKTPTNVKVPAASLPEGKPASSPAR